MDIHYQYIKKRKDLGRQPLFCEVPAYLMDTIPPNRQDQKEYMLRNPVHETVQVGTKLSESEINTITVVSIDQGMNHAEGGWPKDINYLDEEAAARYRRRVERDDAYVSAILHTYNKFEHNIKQNNAIDVYGMYFNQLPYEKPVEKYIVTLKNTYKEPENIIRPVSCIDWTLEEDSKLVTSNCDKTFSMSTRNRINESFVWNIENPSDPLETLSPPSACWQVVCSPAHPALIAGGLEDGRVCIFDIREQSEPTGVSPPHLAHRDPVTALLYIQSRLNTEFFSGSTDGLCMWWDVRNLSQPFDSMIIATVVPQGEAMGLNHAQPVSSLQFDRAFPTRFLCGTDTGFVINVNRRGKTITETMTSVFDAHCGPVKAVHRSPCTSKMFITCGDWRVNIWSDEVTGSPIICGTRQRYQINDVCWAPHRISGYMAISGDGKFRFYDLLRRYKEPVVTYPISKYPLLKMKVHGSGRLVAMGDSKGAIHLVALSDNLVVPGFKDKLMMMQTFERENRREHILENRVKEIRLKLKAEEEATQAAPEVEVNEEDNVRQAEEEYKKMINSELLKAGLPPVVLRTVPSKSRNR